MVFVVVLKLCGVFCFGCFVLFLKVLCMTSALEKEKNYLSELVDILFYTIKNTPLTASIEST